MAEREFLFREVGLERWLNGLDLDGQDAAAKIEKRRQKFEKRRRRRKEENGSDDELTKNTTSTPSGPREVLRYGPDAQSPVEKLEDWDDDDFSSDSDEDAPPEAAGQIKVAMFRVLASGEIKRGEYSPQFDAHDDDEDGNKGGGDEADIDHTTSFAKPKTLDPKSISTQTVTGIDGPDKPFAVFTFFYRGESKFLLHCLHCFANNKARTVAKDGHHISKTTKGNSRCNEETIKPIRLLKSRGIETWQGYYWVFCIQRERSIWPPNQV